MPANQADFLGEGVNTGAKAAHDPNDDPNPANPGGISNNELRRRQAALNRPRASGYTGTASNTGTPMTGVPGATAGYYAGNDQTRAAYNQTYRQNNPTARVDLNPFNTPTPAQNRQTAVTGALPVAGARPDGAQPVGSRAAGSSAYTRQGDPGTAGQPGVGGTGGSRGLPASPAAAGITPPARAPGDPAAGVPNTAGAPPAPVTVDRTAYDAEAARLQELQSTFLGQLERLSGSDPFGNQAALQKSTDRAVAQAAGTAAGARGGAAALAGAQRQAVGVQAQTSARGAQDIIEQRRRDEQQATGLGLQAIGGAADIGKQLTTNEVALVGQLNSAAEINLRQYLGGRELDQSERQSLRNLATEAAKIDMARYQTDVGYRESVNASLTEMYKADTVLQAAKARIDADENMSESDWVMGLLGLGAGLAGGAATSDERAKTNRAKPSTKALRAFVESGAGEFYEYTEPTKPGRRPGRNFGPMAQHLQRSEIGRTLVTPDGDGTLRVDTGRLALADHSALTHLAGRLARLERKAAAKKGRK
jgi:hypothetical protein